MKTKILIPIFLIFIFYSCKSSYDSISMYDDVYYTSDKNNENINDSIFEKYSNNSDETLPIPEYNNDDSDYEYTNRINRFYNGYYDPFLMDNSYYFYQYYYNPWYTYNSWYYNPWYYNPWYYDFWYYPYYPYYPYYNPYYSYYSYYPYYDNNIRYYGHRSSRSNLIKSDIINTKRESRIGSVYKNENTKNENRIGVYKNENIKFSKPKSEYKSTYENKYKTYRSPDYNRLKSSNEYIVNPNSRIRSNFNSTKISTQKSTIHQSPARKTK